MDGKSLIGASFFMDNDPEKNRIRSVIRHTAFGSHPSVLQLSPRVRCVTPPIDLVNPPPAYRHPTFTKDADSSSTEDEGEQTHNGIEQKQSTSKVVKIADMLSVGSSNQTRARRFNVSGATSASLSTAGTPQSRPFENATAHSPEVNVSFGLNSMSPSAVSGSHAPDEEEEGDDALSKKTVSEDMYDPLLTPALQNVQDNEEHENLSRQIPRSLPIPKSQSTSGFVVIDSLSQALGEPNTGRKKTEVLLTNGHQHSAISAGVGMSTRPEGGHPPSNSSFHSAAPVIGSLQSRRAEVDAAEAAALADTSKRKAAAAAKAKLLEKIRKGTALSPAQQRQQNGEGLTHNFRDACPEMAAIDGQVTVPLTFDEEDDTEEGEGDVESNDTGEQPHLSASATHNAAVSPLRANDFSPAENWATMRRLGFPCSVRSEVVEAEYHAQSTLANEINICDYHWNLSLRGVAILGSATVETCESLRKLSRKFGIPSHLRHLMWMTLSGVSLKMDENEGFFKVISEKFGLVSGPSQEVIEKDLERTFPDHPYFGPGEHGVHRLRLILHALCWRNPLLGYCQSFNFIAAVLLLVLNDDEGTFFMMCHILENLLPNDYYSEGLMGVKIDQKVFVVLLEEVLPRVAQHFDDIRFDVRAIIPAWLMSLYVNTFPIETLLRVWDYMVTERSSLYSTVPMTIALAFLKLKQDDILRTRDPGDMMVLLNTKAACEYDGTRLVKVAHEFELKASVLHNHRRRVREEILIETEKRRKAREQFEAERKSRLQALAAQKAAESRQGTSTASPTELSAGPSSPTSNNKPIPEIRASAASSPTHSSSQQQPPLILTASNNGTNRYAQPHGHDKIAASELAKKGQANIGAPKKKPTKPLHHTDPNHPANATSRKTFMANVVEMKDYGPTQLALPAPSSDKTEKSLAASMLRQ